MTRRASYLADVIRAALDERAGPAENQLSAIRDALAEYDATSESES